MRPFVVMKFGGTSVADRGCWETVVEQARQHLMAGRSPVVVCSAVGGVSDALDKLPEQALGEGFERTLDEIKARHRKLGEGLGVDSDALLADEFEALRRIALGSSLIGEVGARQRARIMASGELMSTKLGAAFFAAQGVDCRWQDAREALLSVRSSGGDWHRYMSARCQPAFDPELSERWAGDTAQVHLTQGFIARDSDGETVLLGRGGSDVSAALLAVALGAECCEIWTDVPGLYTADPRQVAQARLLRRLDYEEAQELASTGAKVLHPASIAPLQAARIPLTVRCTGRPTMPGTTIDAEGSLRGACVKAVAARRGVTLVSMDSVGMWQEVGFLAKAFTAFAAHGLSIDLVSTSETNVTVSLDPSANSVSPEVLDALLAELAGQCQPRVVGPCAAVSVVGRSIRTILHQLAPVFALFEDRQVHLLSQAANDLNLTFVVDEHEADRLIAKLHQLLFADREADAELGPTWQEVFAPTPSPEQLPPWWLEKRSMLLQLADQESTPRYVYDGATIAARAAGLRTLESVSSVHYAMKANDHPEVLRLIADQGLGFECVSPGELEHLFVTLPAFDPSKVLFTPNFAPRSDYSAGFQRGVNVTVDALHPLTAWPEQFTGREIVVRLDPGRGRGHHRHVKTAGRQSKFGVAPEDFDALVAAVEQAGAVVVGLHAHAGSGIRTPEAWADTARFLLAAAERFAHLRFIDVGGGLGIPEKPGQSPLDLSAVDGHLSTVHAVRPDLEIWMEPGRFLVAESGVLLCRVTQVKAKGDVHYVGVDVGMNSLIRPALYGAHHDIVNLSKLGQPRTEVVHVVGPICETGDTLGHARRLPLTEEGDVLMIADAGAYGRVMASHYNRRLPAAETVLT
jgi:bifunctional diaminopimelate decarboxylase / aspartate kinase